MKKEVFALVCTRMNGDEFKIGFFDTEDQAWDFVGVVYDSEHYSFAVRPLTIDLFEDESLVDAFLRADREDRAADPDRYYRLLAEFDLW